MNKFILFLLGVLILTACATTAPVIPTPVEAQPLPEIFRQLQPVEAPTIPTATTVVQPTQAAPQGFEGYFLEFVQEVKDFHVPERSQNLRLMYQKNGQVAEVADFCVHGSFWNTPAGVWFIIEDKATTYPSAPKGYKTVLFPHNLAYSASDAGDRYIHSAEWNDTGPFGCPLFISHGCVNMRPGDFDLLIFGGTYTNPFTGQVSAIDPIKIGTPLVIAPKADSCTTVEDCMKLMKCATGFTCFKKYTFADGHGPETAWADLLAQAPNLLALDK